MSESELMNKFDAFMKRHRGKKTEEIHDDIPVLTDIVSSENDIQLANHDDATQAHPIDISIDTVVESQSSIAELSQPALPNELTIQSDEDFPTALSADNEQEPPTLVDVYKEPSTEFDEIFTSSSTVESPLNVSKLSDAEAEQLARDIYIRIMSDIDGRVSRELRIDMSKRISAMVDKTVSAAIEDFKQELANIVSDAISETLLQRTEQTIKK